MLSLNTLVGLPNEDAGASVNGRRRKNDATGDETNDIALSCA